MGTRALTLALRAGVEARLARGGRVAAPLARVLCDLDPYGQDTLALALRLLHAGGGEPAARALYDERRAALLEVGEHLPRTPGEFLTAAPV